MAYYRRRNYYNRAPAEEAWDDTRVDEVKARLEALRNSDRLTTKFVEVVESFTKFIEEKRYLTGGQENFLKSIEEQTLVDNEWENNFSAAMREDLVIAAKYYKTTCYFGRLVELVLNDPENYVPSQRDYEKLVLNKYAQKAIKAHKTPAQWKRGDMALIRATTRDNDLDKDDERVPFGSAVKLHNQVVLIVGEEGGPRLYKTLKVMCPSVPALGIFSIEERKLKKYRSPKK